MVIKEWGGNSGLISETNGRLISKRLGTSHTTEPIVREHNKTVKAANKIIKVCERMIKFSDASNLSEHAGPRFKKILNDMKGAIS